MRITPHCTENMLNMPSVGHNTIPNSNQTGSNGIKDLHQCTTCWFVLLLYYAKRGKSSFCFPRNCEAEIFHGMNHKQGREGWMAIKADMEKA